MIQYRIVLIALLIFNSVVFSQTTISIDKVFGTPPTSVLVPVRVSGVPLSSIKSISLQFSYDVNTVTFNHSASHPQSGIANIQLPGTNNFFVSNYNGVISFSWIYSEGVSFSGKMFDLDFQYLSGFSELRLLSATIKDIQGKKLAVTLIHGSIAVNTNPAIKVIYPNGGENLEVFGSPVNLTWTSIYITNVKLEYTTDNGSTWNTIVESYEAIKNSYLWSVPHTINSANCKIKISDVTPAGVSDQSDAVFTIDSTPVITITTPDGGEQLKVGGVKTIQWSFKNIQNIKLEYCTNASSGSPSWQTIIESIPANNNSYNWVIPDAVSGDCKLRVTDLANPTTIFDISNAIFTIHNNPVALTVANTVDAKVQIIGRVVEGIVDLFWWWKESDGWKSEKAHYSKDGIEYDAVDTLILNGTIPVSIGWLTSVQYFEIYLNYNPDVLILESLIPAIPELENLNYSYDNGVIHVIWGTDEPIDIHGKIFDLKFRYVKFDKPLQWLNSGWDYFSHPSGDPNTPTATIDPRNFSDIKIDMVSAKNSLNDFIDVSSWTNGSLAISNKKAIKLLSPESGDTLEVNDGTYNILWSSRSVVNVSISYSTNNGSSWTTIIASTPASSGTYKWTLPNINSTTCRVKIVSGDGTAKDENSAAFTLTNQKALNLISPNGGEVLKTGAVKNITWSCRNISNVKLHYSTEENPTWVTIAESVPAKDYKYAWTLPAVNSTTCKVRITNTAVPEDKDISAAVFTINNSKTKITIANAVSILDSIRVPVSSEQVSGSTYFNLSIKYNTAVMSLDSITKKPVIGKGYLSYLDDNGIIRIVWFSTTPVDFSGELFVMKFENYTKVTSPVEFDTPNQVKDAFNKVMDLEFVNGSVASSIVNNQIFAKDNAQNENVPVEYDLAQNYPNPFNPVTTIKYAIPKESHVVITIYNMLGESISTLVDEIKEPGFYNTTWKADNYASGIYYYSIMTEKFAETKKMILLK